MVYEREEDAEAFLKEYITTHAYTIHKASILQCSISIGLVKALLEANAVVTIYTQDENAALQMGSKQQAKFIVDSYDQLAMSLSRPMLQYPVKVYKYKYPSVMNGIKINEDILCVSWYLYQYPHDKNLHALGPFTDDTMLILGHLSGAIVVDKSNDNFNALMDTFNILEENYREKALLVFPKESVVGGSVNTGQIVAATQPLTGSAQTQNSGPLATNNGVVMHSSPQQDGNADA